MRILEICPYSAGICGVWSRVKEEALRLSNRGNEVIIFSSNLVKGSNEIAKPNDALNNIKIRRFKAIKLGGESFMYWDFIKEGLKLKPDVIFVHNYRHIHTLKGLKLAELLKESSRNTKVLLITHAPFVEGNITRKWHEKIIVSLYDKIVGPLTLNKYDKVVTISKWENSYLFSAGLSKDKICYIPNGIPEEYFSKKIANGKLKILFFGRVAPIKNLEIVIQAMSLINNKRITLEIAGPSEPNYLKHLKRLARSLSLGRRVVFTGPLYALSQKIEKYDSAKIFVLPSLKEGMPQSLIEAMARQRIVIGSNIISIRDIIQDGKNGYVFEPNNSQSLADIINKINLNSKTENDTISLNARKSVERYSWSRIIKRIEKIIEN